MQKENFTVPFEEAELRIDVYLAKVLRKHYSRTKIKQLIETGVIRLNGKAVKPHTKIVLNDSIVVNAPEHEEMPDRAEAIPINVIYEDQDLIIVDKSAGLVVHPGSGNPNGTLVNALLHYSKSLSSLGDSENRPGIVHRLDKDTSGLMVVAKNNRAHRVLGEQFKNHQINRAYWVVVKGIVQHDEMRANAPLGRSLTNRKLVVVRYDNGKESMTNFKVLKRFKKATLLEARPATGRMHQIRVHLRMLDYPVVGDLTYGVASPFIGRQALHAKELGFHHPITNKKMLFQSELPEDMVSLIEHLK
jgi:23S rRNA pseudouridine1911/1915/1917 synthase